VALWVDAANGVRIHARVFLPAHAAASKEPELRNAVSSTFLEAVRLAARMGDAVLLLPPTGGAVETWIWSGTVAALTAARKTVICLDFRGQGSSSAPAGRYSLPMVRARVMDIAACLRADASARFITCSWRLMRRPWCSARAAALDPCT
jgi:pimeloyl-ACP methyl ester carboxylesterase